MYKSNIEKNYKTEIDGLRAFAVVAVIINHTYSSILPNGFRCRYFFRDIRICSYIIFRSEEK